jgi:phosphoribosylanthranilate isomerase
MVRVKICGTTHPDDAVAAARAGADAVGVNLVAGPRRVDVATAGDIFAALPPCCTPVALVELRPHGLSGELLELLGRHWVSHIQVYGTVTPEVLALLRGDNFKPLVACAVNPETFPDELNQTLADLAKHPPAGVVLDAHQPGKLGGTGKTLDWSALADARTHGKLKCDLPIMLAGGLNPENIAQAVRTVRPWAVDVASGVETEIGRKDPTAMQRFVAAAKRASIAPASE